MLPAEVRKLKPLEAQKTKLKQLVVDPNLDKKMLQDVLSKKDLSLLRRRHILKNCGFYYGINIGKACETFLLHRSVFYYRSRQHSQVGLKQCIKDITLSRISYGYRQVPYSLIEGRPAH
jgi:hypothetical protein